MEANIIVRLLIISVHVHSKEMCSFFVQRTFALLHTPKGSSSLSTNANALYFILQSGIGIICKSVLYRFCINVFLEQCKADSSSAMQ